MHQFLVKWLLRGASWYSSQTVCGSELRSQLIDYGVEEVAMAAMERAHNNKELGRKLPTSGKF